MIARRLLMGGGGAFVAPPVPAQFTVSAAPQGGYARGQAFYHAGYSYISTVNDALTEQDDFDLGILGWGIPA